MKKRITALLLALMMLQTAALAQGVSPDTMLQMRADGFSADIDAIDQAAKSVLMLEVYDENDRLFATGSGFVAFDNSTLITNYHVVEGASWMRATSDDGYQYIVTKVLVADEQKDIAICGFERPTDLVPLEFHGEEELKRAQPVVAIGSPKGIKNTVSLGNISALYEEDNVNWIQFTAPISSGSSGGALFDNEGYIIGVTSATYNDEMAQNINFAVHISEVTRLYAAWDGVERDLAEHEQAVAGTSGGNRPDPQPGGNNGPSSGGASSYTALKRGDFNTAVIRLQKALAKLGYFNDSADGVFDEATENAVAEFNMQNFGTNSGVADEQMQQLLFEGDPVPYGKSPEQPEEPEEEPAPETTGSAYQVLERGDFSVLVINLQKALAALGYFTDTADGVYDEATEKAVAAFNLKNFGTDSGVADEQMQQLLFEGDPVPFNGAPEEQGSSSPLAMGMPIFFPKDSSATVKWLDNDLMSVCFDVSNRSDRVVTEFHIYVYATDKNGEKIYGDSFYSLPTTIPVAPGAVVDSVVFTVGQSSKIHKLYAGVVSATFEDGTIYTIQDWEVQYDSWTIVG